MTSLKNLLAKRNGASSESDAAATPVSAEPQAVAGNDAAGPATIQSDSPTPTQPAGRPANPFGRKPAGGTPTVSVGTDSAGVTTDATGGSPVPDKPRLAGLSTGSLKSESPAGSGSASLSASLAGLSLESLSESDDTGIAPVRKPSFFEDETPAQCPTRELPDGVTKEEMGFVGLIDSVYNILHEPEFLGSVIKNIIIELKNHPEYSRLIADEDVRQWVRGMRESMGLAKIKKQETKTKRAGGGGSKSKLVDDDMLADLAMLGVTIPE